VTSLFPSASQPTHGIFVLQRLQAMARHGAWVQVLAPVPYVPPGPVPERYAELRAIPRSDEIGGFPVRYPRYPMIPKISMNAQAWSYARGITGAVRQAIRTWQPHLLDATLLVQQQRHLAVALDARQRVDRHPAQVPGMAGGFEGGVHPGFRRSPSP
jgi:hypothetical protein